VRVTSGKYVRTIENIRDYIIQNCNIWTGNPTNLFDSKLRWDNGSGYLCDSNDLPNNSVGFWICHKDLTLYNSNNKNYYSYKSRIPYNNKRLPYKGIDEPIQTIISGTIIRVSLAKWWQKPNTNESRCYLQLSGWYL
jgi:hypothetical protein